MPAAHPIIGIDLGTTNSLVAVADQRGPRIVLDEEGRALLPSVVWIRPDGSRLVGESARRHAVEFPTETIASVKRLMGKSVADVADDLSYLPYEVVEGEQRTARIRVHGRIFSPQEISAMILQRLREIAEQSLGPVRKAVITVPAYFDDAQRQATRDAGRFAGLEVARIINEPTAAALAYGLGRANKEELIAVYDLGGGTFDISILRIMPAEVRGQESGVREEAADSTTPDPRPPTPDPAFFQVLSTAGDTHLGGEDVDRMIVELVQREIRAQFGTSLSFPPSTQQALRNFAEATKIRLSEQESATIEVDLGDDRLYRRTISRDEFEKMIQPWVERTIDRCRHALRDAKLDPKQIERVVMVGGATRTPLVRRLVGEFFESQPYTALDPDQVVALGAAVQGAILAGTQPEALLLDVIPLSLGIETLGGAVAKLILRNSTVPARVTERFTTSVDGQTSIKVNILQGERELVKDCRSLGEFHLTGIPPMPAGIPQLEVTVHVDVNGILDVQAVERRSGKRAAVQIVPHHGLTRAEVERIERESFEHAREDMHLHRLIDLRVNAALDIKWINDCLARVGDDLDETYRAEIDRHIAILRDFIARSESQPMSVDANAFQQAKESLDRVSIRLHEMGIAKSLRE